MLRHVYRLPTCVCLWIVGAVAVLNAQDGQLSDAIPDSASVVVRWKTPQATWGKLADFVDTVQPGVGGAIKAGMPEIGTWIGVPGLKGIDSDKDFWAIVFAESQEVPGVVFIVTATDVDLVKQTVLANDFEVHTAGSLVAYSKDEDALGKIRARLNSDGKTLSSQIDAASKAVFQAADLSFLVNVKQLAAEFSEEINQAEPQLDALIDQIISAMPDEQHTQMEAVFDLYRQIGKSLLIAVRETNSLTSGVTFTKTSIRYEDRLQVAEGTETAAFLAKQPPGELSLLNRLPVNKAVYVGAKFDLSNMIEWSMKFSRSMLTKDMTPEQSSQMDEAIKEMVKLKYDEMAFYLDLNGKSPALQTGAVSLVTPTNVAREISHKMLKCMSELKTTAFTQTTKLEKDAEKITGGAVDRITIKQEFDASADPMGFQKKLQSMLFGDEGIQQLIMYQPNRTLQIMGGAVSDLKTLATSLESTKSNDSIVAVTRQRQLQKSEKANLLVLTDVSRLAVSGIKLAAQQNLLQINSDELDKITLQPSFVGYGLSMEPTAVKTQWNIPVEQAQNIAKIVHFVRSGL